MSKHRLRNLELAVDAISYHIDNIMSADPTALEHATLLVKLQDLQKRIEEFKSYEI